MSFRYEAFYLVEPRQTLASRLRDFDDANLAAILLEPNLYRRQENSGESWLHGERVLQTKLLFLATLRQYTGIADDAGFARVLGSPHISVDLFDQWWVVRRFEVEQELEQMDERLREHKACVEPTGNARIDQWLGAL